MMRIPFVLMAGRDDESRRMFVTAFEKKVAYAALITEDSGKAALGFLANCDWYDLPDLIILDYLLPDMTATDLVRELLMDNRCRPIPKIIELPETSENLIRECTILGVHDFLKQGRSLIECEGNVQRVDFLLQAELNF